MNSQSENRSLGTFVDATRQFLELYAEAMRADPSTLTGWSLEDRNPKVIEQLMPFFGWVYHNYFRVQTTGWDHIPNDKSVLLIGSHNGGLAAPDTVMMTYDWFRYFGTERLAYALMEPNMWTAYPGTARLATQVGCIRADAHMALSALQRQASLLIYPGGVQDVFRPHTLRHRIHFCGNHSFIKLALLEEIPIIPFISYGAHDTLIVIADLYPQLRWLHEHGMPWPFGIDPGTWPIYLGLPWILALGPLPNIPLPIQIHTRVRPPITFQRYGHAAAHDHDYVQECYEQVRSSMQQDLDELVASVGRAD